MKGLMRNSRFIATSRNIYIYSICWSIISGVAPCDNFTVGLRVENYHQSSCITEGTETESELMPKFKLL